MALPKFKKGNNLLEEVTADKLNAMCEEIRQAQICPSSTIMVGRTPGGTTLEVRRSSGGIAAAVEPKPWDILDLTGVGEPTDGIFSSYTATVQPGLINGITANNMMDDFSVDPTLTYWTADCTTDGKAITYVEISTSTTAPDPQSAGMNVLPTNFSVLFGITFNGISYRTIGTGNPTATSSLVLMTDKVSPPPPGMPTQDGWYIWAIA
jgi:hypothetical protein